MRSSSNRSGRQQDSGWSYLVCACATFSQAVNMGLVFNFGVLFPVIIKQFYSSRGETAWIGSLCLGLVFLAGPVAASITEKLNCRLGSIIGTVTVAVGLIMTSFAKSIIIFYFTYGLIVGFGACCIRISSFLVVAQYFHRQKPFATGMLTAGAGMGMFLVAPLIQTLLVNFGLHNTFRFLAGIVFVSGFSALVYDPNVEETDPKDSATLELDDENNETGGKMKIVDCSVWRVPTFTVFSLVFMLNCAGTFVPIIHLVEYAQEKGISSSKSFQLQMIIGLASCVGKLVAGFVCNVTCIEPRYVFQVGSFVTAISVILFTVVHSYGLFVFLSAFFGVAQGAVVATSNLIFLTCVDNKRRASTFGLAGCLTSLAILSSPPFAGFLADELESYAPAFYFAGGGLVVCALLPFLLLCIKEPGTKDPN